MPYPIPKFERADPAPGCQADAHAVAAALITEDGRFLMHLRDDKPGIAIPGHWAFFAGHVEDGETADEALPREMEEELGLKVTEAHWIFELLYALPRPRQRTVRKAWYVVPLALDAIPTLTLMEGAGMGLFTLEEMLKLNPLSPWDAAVAMMLARHAATFPE